MVVTDIWQLETFKEGFETKLDKDEQYIISCRPHLYEKLRSVLFITPSSCPQEFAPYNISVIKLESEGVPH